MRSKNRDKESLRYIYNIFYAEKWLGIENFLYLCKDKYIYSSDCVAIGVIYRAARVENF